MNIKLKQINPNPSNPRFIRDDQFEKLKRSLAQFPAMLQKRGIAVVKDGGKWVAIGGNQRQKALKELEKEIHYPNFPEMYGSSNDAINVLWRYFNHGVPCVDCTEFSEAERKRFIIADNVPFGEWDNDVLANEWEVNDLADWGLSIDFEQPDYSDKNKEIDVDEFSDLMELKFKFEQDVYNEVKDKLLSIGETIEDGLLKLLENVSA